MHNWLGHSLQVSLETCEGVPGNLAATTSAAYSAGASFCDSGQVWKSCCNVCRTSTEVFILNGNTIQSKHGTRAVLLVNCNPHWQSKHWLPENIQVSTPIPKQAVHNLHDVLALIIQLMELNNRWLLQTAGWFQNDGDRSTISKVFKVCHTSYHVADNVLERNQ